jgi:dienelactone hydrolase
MPTPWADLFLFGFRSTGDGRASSVLALAPMALAMTLLVSLSAKRFNGAQFQRRVMLMLVVTTCLHLGMAPAVGGADIPEYRGDQVRQTLDATALSADGRWAVSTVTTYRGRDRTSKLVAIDLARADAVPVELLSLKGQRVEWIGSRNALSYVDPAAPNELRSYDIDAHREQTLYKADGDITLWAWNEVGTEALVVTRKNIYAQQSDVSFRTDDPSLLNLIKAGGLAEDLKEADVSIWRIDIATERARLVSNRFKSVLSAMFWGDNAVVVVPKNINIQWDVELYLYPSAGETPTRLFETLQSIDFTSVSTHAQSLAFSSSGPPDDRVLMFRSHTPYVVSALGATPHRVESLISRHSNGLWLDGSTRIWAEQANMNMGAAGGENALVLADITTNKVIRRIKRPGTTLSNCSLRPALSLGICIEQGLTESPRLVKIDLAQGNVSSLPAVIPEESLPETTWRTIDLINSYGGRSTSFLALPDEVKPGAEIPLAVIMYGFGYNYSRNAQWINEVPVEEMRKNGIAVLLMNFPAIDAWRKGDVTGARIAMKDGPLATLDEAVKCLEPLGYRRGRTMVMGYSMGGFIAAHAIFRRHDLVAAYVGDPAQYTLTGYTIANIGYQKSWMEPIFGGPPTSAYIDNYLNFSPGADGSSTSGPILLELNGGPSIPALEFAAYFRAAGAKFFTYVYPDGTHPLSRLDQIQVAQVRNLAWVKLNLLGPASLSDHENTALGFDIAGWTVH